MKGKRHTTEQKIRILREAEQSDTTAVEVTQLFSPHGDAAMKFGGHVHMTGSTLMVGGQASIAIGDDNRAVGVEYIFDISDPATPALLSWFTMYGEDFPLAEAPTISGHVTELGPVAVNGTMAVITSPKHPYQSPSDPHYVEWNAGAAFVFDISDLSAPVLTDQLVPDTDVRMGYYFGHGIAVKDELAYVGALELGGPYYGSMQVFDFSLLDGDVNFDREVNIDDISYVLFRLGGTSYGDANGDGTVDVNDISYVLFRLGDLCP